MTAAAAVMNAPASRAPRRVLHRRIGALALVWFLCCLAWSAPAQLLVLVLQPLLPQLQLQNVSGGFWHGSAAQAYWGPHDKVIALGKLEWRIAPWSLLWLHPQADVSTRYGEQSVEMRARLSPLGRIVLRDASAALPAQVLGYWLPLPAAGTLALNLKRAEFTDTDLLAVDGELHWQRAQWQWGNGWLMLGDYRCVLRTEGPDKLQCALRGQGALAGNGTLAIDSNDHSWSADLKVKMHSELPPEFRQTVTMLLAGKADANGELQVQRSGRW